MKQARRFARWLRLVVTCLAFVIGSPAPAIAVDPIDTIVMVAEDRSPEAVAVDAPIAAGEAATSTSETLDAARCAASSRRIASRIYLANCALLL